jgi:hypothetical protein
LTAFVTSPQTAKNAQYGAAVGWFLSAMRIGRRCRMNQQNKLKQQKLKQQKENKNEYHTHADVLAC